MSNNFNYELLAYQNSYKKIRYWIGILYFFLLSQIWISTTLPEKQILFLENKMSPVKDFLIYYKRNFYVNGDDSNNEITEKIRKSISYQVPWNLRQEGVTHKYFQKVRNTLDSLRSIGLIDSSKLDNFRDSLFQVISKLTDKYQKINRDESSLSVEKNGHIQTELNRILKQNVSKMQREVNTKFSTLFTYNLSIPINISIKDKIENLNEDELLSYNILTEKINSISIYLDKNIVKTPYLDLPLSNKPALFVILFLSAFLYWYVYVLRKYYANIQVTIEKCEIEKVTSVPSTKNILAVLGIKISPNTSELYSLLFFDIVPLLIFSYYLWTLWGIDLESISCFLLLILGRYSLYKWFKYREIFYDKYGVKMKKEILINLFQRDLDKLKTEITSYKDENKMWEVNGEIKNSAGNLCLHICGNLQHFIGSVLGSSGYVRERDAEFSRKNVPVDEMIKEIDKTILIVKDTLSEIDENKLEEIYPINVFGNEMTTGFFLAHLTTHLNYHLGQINYHRRMFDK